MATIKQINEYLAIIKSITRVVIINTPKNRKTRFKLGITVEDQKDIIRNLEASDYRSGPENDRDSSQLGEVWKFKRSEFGKLFYIKIKIVISTEIKALSCHIDNIIV